MVRYGLRVRDGLQMGPGRVGAISVLSEGSTLVSSTSYGPGRRLAWLIMADTSKVRQRIDDAFDGFDGRRTKDESPDGSNGGRPGGLL
jgi:hypothetical protein